MATTPRKISVSEARKIARGIQDRAEKRRRAERVRQAKEIARVLAENAVSTPPAVGQAINRDLFKLL